MNKIRLTIKKFSISIFILLCLLCICSGCNQDTKLYIHNELGFDAECVYIHSDEQNKYLNGDYNKISSYALGTKEMSKPKPVTLSWDLNTGKNATVLISENPEFTNFLTYHTDENKIDIYNLKIKTFYYYKVTNEDIQVQTETKCFYIDENCIRNLNIEGLINCRDLGGWNSKIYGVVKQGLIYRTSRLTENQSQDPLITNKGINELKEVLGVKTELDLRQVSNNENGGLSSSVLGNDVNYYSIPMDSNGNILLLNRNVLPDLFKIFGNKDNYPICFHCSIGTDRTGLVAFLLNALLGVSEEDLYRDYLFSNFANIGSARTANTLEKNYFPRFEFMEGDNLAARVYNYLVLQGVDSSDLDNFIKIMTED